VLRGARGHNLLDSETGGIVKLHRIISKHLRSAGDASRADVQAAVAVNVAEPEGSTTSVSSRQRIVQRTRNGRSTTTVEHSDRPSATTPQAPDHQEDA
jgi:hypothetical protein